MYRDALIVMSGLEEPEGTKVTESIKGYVLFKATKMQF